LPSGSPRCCSCSTKGRDRALHRLGGQPGKSPACCQRRKPGRVVLRDPGSARRRAARRRGLLRHWLLDRRRRLLVLGRADPFLRAASVPDGRLAVHRQVDALLRQAGTDLLALLR
jgi:hypothetical protein